MQAFQRRYVAMTPSCLLLYLNLLQWTAISLHSQSVVEVLEESVGGTVLIDNLQHRFHTPTHYTSSSDLQPYFAIGNPSSPGITQLELRTYQQSPSPNVQLIVKPGHRGPDREALCPLSLFSSTATPNIRQTQPCDLNLIILYGNRGNPSYGKLTLRLLDVNDNSPQFKGPSTVELRVPERFGDKSDTNSLESYRLINQRYNVAHKLTLPKAYDLDSDENGIKSYRLLVRSDRESSSTDLSMFALGEEDQYPSEHQSSNYFNLVPALRQDSGYHHNQGIVSSSSTTQPIEHLTLFVLGDGLDREQLSEIWFNLLAIDGGSPAKTGTLTIRLMVTDLNDNAPKFRKPIYHQSTITATSTRSDDSRFMSIDQQNLEKQIVVLPESLPIGSPIMTLVADDPDKGQNAKVSYRIKDSSSSIDSIDAFSWFSLATNSNGTGNLVVAGKLDADAKTSSSRLSDSERQQFDRLHLMTSGSSQSQVSGRLVRLTIEAIDEGSPSLSSSTDIEIMIQNTNDNIPHISIQYTNPVLDRDSEAFSHSLTSGSVVENADTPMTIAHLTVFDEDYSSNAVDIVGGNSDVGQNQLNGIDCRLNDTNFAIEKVQQHVQMAIHDTSDGGPQLHFFRISSLKPLDREKGPLVFINVDCVDQVPETNSFHYGGTPIHSPSLAHNVDNRQLTGTTQLRIIVQDVNDNAPKFTATRYRFSVPETVDYSLVRSNTRFTDTRRTKVGQVHAVDLDEGDNGRVRYKMVPSTNSNAFQVDETTGVVWRIGPIDREQVDKVALIVEAADKGEPTPLSSTCTVEVYIDDLNDNAPYWVAPIANNNENQEGNDFYNFASGEDGVFYFSVYENSAIGALVGKVKAIDIDRPGMKRDRISVGGDNQVESSSTNLIYSFKQASESTRSFTINPRSGELRLSRQLDRETRAHYEINVLAIDNHHQRSNFDRKQGNGDRSHHFTVTATVIITVLDVNDNYPQFESPYSGKEILFEPGSSMTTAGSTLFTAKANDPDNGDNGTVRYALGPDQLFGSRQQTLIEIDSTTGVCYLRESLTTQSFHDLLMSRQLAYEQSSDTGRDEMKAVDSQADASPASPTTTMGNDQSITFSLLVIAYDLGQPQSLNSSRSVRLVWSTNPQSRGAFANSFVSGFGQSLTGLGQTSFTPTLVIPLICGIILFIVLIGLILGALFHRRHRRRLAAADKKRGKDGGSLSPGRPSCDKWSPGYPPNKMGSNSLYRNYQSSNGRSPHVNDGKLDRELNARMAGNDANDLSIYQTLPDPISKQSFQPYLPVSYTTLSAVPCHPVSFFPPQYNTMKVNLTQSRANSQQQPQTLLPSTRPPLFAMSQAQPFATSSYNLRQLTDRLNCTPPIGRRQPGQHQNSSSLTRHQVDGSVDQHQPSYDVGCVGSDQQDNFERSDTSDLNANFQVHEGSGWKAKLSDAYTENTFI